MQADSLLQAERDALGLLGVLAHAFLTWDPPIPVGKGLSGDPEVTHYRGLNIQALVIDNADGEILALAKNAIHTSEDPTKHAEQSALRVAHDRLRGKHPRSAGMTVENYYREQLFYREGNDPAAFVRTGCTLVTSLEPCPMCASTLCVARMKRVAYVIADHKFGGAWPTIQARFYQHYQLAYGLLELPRQASPWLDRVQALHAGLTTRIDVMRGHVQDTWFLDRLRDDLAQSLALLSATEISDFATNEADRQISQRTLMDLKRLCGLPETAPTP